MAITPMEQQVRRLLAETDAALDEAEVMFGDEMGDMPTAQEEEIGEEAAEMEATEIGVGHEAMAVDVEAAAACFPQARVRGPGRHVAAA